MHLSTISELLYWSSVLLVEILMEPLGIQTHVIPSLTAAGHSLLEGYVRLLVKYIACSNGGRCINGSLFENAIYLYIILNFTILPVI